MIVSCGTDSVEHIYFDWPLTNWCNYKCSYCPVVDIVTNDFTKDDHTSMYKVTLARLRKVEIPFNICLTGGEPTLHPNILDILEQLSNMPNCQDVSLFTNFTRPVKFYEQVVKSNKIVIFASYHPEFATDKFFKRCLELKALDRAFSVHVTLSDKPEHWQQTKQLMDDLQDNDIIYKPCLISPTALYTPNYDEKFDLEFRHYLDNTGKNHSGNFFFKEIPVVFDDGTTKFMKDYDIELGRLNKFKGYNCKTVSYMIDMDGTVKNSCTGRAVPLSLTNDNLIVTETCPKEVCPGRRLFNFYKWK